MPAQHGHKLGEISRLGELVQTHAWQEAHNESPDQTLVSYDGLGAVVANEQGGPLGSSVEEFRNDAFGNVLRRLTRRSAGGINDVPFIMGYGIKGDLTSQHAQIKSPPEGIYQREDDLDQSFSSGRMTRQGEVVRNPNSGDVELQLAERNYYGADDRLMTVQRYSWRSETFKDGTWEEYRYDALGRRVMTRARRDPALIYDAFVSGPLCQGTTPPICRSFTERVLWDGDQALMESRTPLGTSDASNSGVVGNVHGLALDEPLAVITTTPTAATRIINYNWRGQGMSSVFPNGKGGDNVTGGSTEIEWPAATQAQTYFTPAFGSNPDNTPKKWMGTFVQNGQGTTGMLYRRNRYFDPNTGRFTQEDPMGIAGGLNAYGFANGDPVNFSDPFGLLSCPLGGDVCLLGGGFNRAMLRYRDLGNAILARADKLVDRISVYAEGNTGVFSVGAEVSGNGSATASFQGELNTQGIGAAAGMRARLMTAPPGSVPFSSSVRLGPGSLVVKLAVSGSAAAITSIGYEFGKGIGRNMTVDPTRGASVKIPWLPSGCASTDRTGCH